jgi:hypothetical protein
MKKIIVALLFGFFGFAQETEFKFSKDGFTDFVVTEVTGKTQSELYKKSIDWVSVTYKNPKEVIKAQIENDYVRIEGIKESIMSGYLGMKHPIMYEIEISLKEGRYKFDLLSIKYYVPANQYSAGYWKNYEIKDVADHYKKTGEIKSKYKDDHENFPAYFNQLNKELFTFLSSENIPSKKNDW